MFELVVFVYYDLVFLLDDRMEEELLEEVEEYFDENGVCVRRIVRCYVIIIGIRR